MYYHLNRSQASTRTYQCSHGVNSVALHPNQAEIISGDQGGVIRRWDLTVNGSRVEMVYIYIHIYIFLFYFICC